jgi:Tannase and feruloyl esterase
MRKPLLARPLGCALLVLAAGLAGCGGGSGGSTPPPTSGTAAPQPLTCDQLTGMTIPAASIGLPTAGAVVTAASGVAASGTGAKALPDYCLVTGTIAPVDTTAPKITFKLALPTTAWNSKVMMFGGGGFDGSVPGVTGNVPLGSTTTPTPLGRGYATFASDSGHEANALASLDGSFGLNDEAIANWAGDALKKTRDTAMYLIKARYAVSSVQKAYFAGGSTGGRESIEQITRWPDDWDGAIAWYPAWNQTSALLGGHRVNRAMAQPDAYPSVAKRALLQNAALAACDGLDGAMDGVINDQVRCNAIFDPATATFNGVPLRCPGGVDTGDTCLSDAQITALKVINTDAHFNYQLASGQDHYPGFNVWGADLGITTKTASIEPTVTFLALGTSQPVLPMPTTAPYISQMTDQWIQYFITRSPGYNSLSLDPENPGPWEGRISEMSIEDDVPIDLSSFAAKGGKLLLAHGTVDVLVSTRATEEYYQRLQAQMTPAAVSQFVRFYEVPGLGHAASSTFNPSWDSLTALENWAEQGTAPANQVMTDTVGVPGRTRPMCDFPTWALYNGTGDVNQASSWTCVEHETIP